MVLIEEDQTRKRNNREVKRRTELGTGDREVKRRTELGTREFITGSWRVAARFYITSRPFLPLLGVLLKALRAVQTRR
jgi:hypothetical protein